MKSKMIVIMVLAVVICALLSGCGTGGAADKSPAPDTGVSGSTAASDSGGADKEAAGDSGVPDEERSETNQAASGTSGTGQSAAADTGTDTTKTNEVLNNIISQLDDLDKLYSELEQDDFSE